MTLQSRRINIVSRDYDSSDRIIPRLARMLSYSSGWSIDTTWDPTADVNYFFPYLEYDPKCPTKTAAWFTHQEDPEQWPDKARVYDEVAAAVDYRTASAAQYVQQLSEYGPSYLVSPGVDWAFKARPPIGNNKPHLMTCGWVYKFGRKGEHLLRQLHEAHRHDFVYKVAGDGWPIHSRIIDWKELPSFYRTGDFYLCTSLVEGIPYPPLEALMTGRPVVVPRGVGMLDELGDEDWIFRYTAGDYDEMEAAVTDCVSALDTLLPRWQEISQSVAHYNPDNWRAAHQRLYSELFHSPVRTPPSTGPGVTGAYVVAFGENARTQAHVAISSFRKWMPDIPVMFAGTEPLGPETLFHQAEDIDVGGRIAKMSIDANVPRAWEYVLYLDADTEVVADISPMFQWLYDGWDLVITKNPGRFHVMHQMLRPDNLEETEQTIEELGSRDLLQLNGGVFAYRRNEQTAEFFKLWLEEWNRWGQRDQPALHRALWRQPLRVYAVGNEWNTVTVYDDPETSAGILHYPQTARRWTGILPGRLDSKEAWKVVNVQRR